MEQEITHYSRGKLHVGRDVAEYMLSRHGVHIGRLQKKGNKIKIKMYCYF